jgi:hypothetical protein
VIAALGYFFETPIPREARLWLDGVIVVAPVVAGEQTFRLPTCADVEQRTPEYIAPERQHSEHVSCIAEWDR